MKYQLKQKDGTLAWIFDNGTILEDLFFDNEQSAKDLHFKTFGGLVPSNVTENTERFFFFYRNQPVFENACKESEIEDSIRYWLGKSPGIYKDDIEKIISVPDNA